MPQTSPHRLWIARSQVGIDNSTSPDEHNSYLGRLFGCPRAWDSQTNICTPPPEALGTARRAGARAGARGESGGGGADGDQHLTGPGGGHRHGDGVFHSMGGFGSELEGDAAVALSSWLDVEGGIRRVARRDQNNMGTTGHSRVSRRTTGYLLAGCNWIINSLNTGVINKLSDIPDNS